MLNNMKMKMMVFQSDLSGSGSRGCEVSKENHNVRGFDLLDLTLLVVNSGHGMHSRT